MLLIHDDRERYNGFVGYAGARTGLGETGKGEGEWIRRSRWVKNKGGLRETGNGAGDTDDWPCLTLQLHRAKNSCVLGLTV